MLQHSFTSCSPRQMTFEGNTVCQEANDSNSNTSPGVQQRTVHRFEDKNTSGGLMAACGNV